MKAILVLVCLLGALAQSPAQTAFVRLSTYPSMSVADARSTVNVSAEVRDNTGRTVPDGTQVVFESTLGSFRETIVKTTGGVARGTLIAPGFPGTAKITVSCLAFNATSNIEFEFVSDRSLLSSASEYVEIVAPGYMMFSIDSKIIGAAGPEQGVHVRYRDVEVRADDIQLNIPLSELRARKARLKLGGRIQEFDELYLKLNLRKGLGTTTIPVEMLTEITGAGRLFAAKTESRPRYGPVEIRTQGVKPHYGPVEPTMFEFEDLSASAAMVSAQKAVVFPRKEIQFHRAEVYVGGAKMLKLPLFQVSLTGGTPILTDNIVNVNNNQLAINYPHYLSLKPGETSLLRFHTGQSYGRTLGGVGGMFLDYELNWNRGDDMDGSLTVSGLGRSDWSVGVRQYVRLDDRTAGFAQIESPGHRSVFGSGNLSRQFDGFQATLSASTSRSLTGPRVSSEHYSLVMEKDPTKVGRLPVRLFYGLTATHQASMVPSFVPGETGFARTSQSAIGLRLRGQLLPQSLDQNTTLNASFSVAKLQGRNTTDGLTMLGSASVSRRFGADASLLMTYDFSRDNFNSAISGQHRLSLQGYYNRGRTSFTGFTARSLDVDRSNTYFDLSYRISGVWRLGYSYTFDRFAGSSYLDYNAMLAYRYGWREFGLTWSKRTHRFGIQILGATFD